MWVVREWQGVSFLLVEVVMVVVVAQDTDFQTKEGGDVQLNVSSPAPTELLAVWTFENNETSYFEMMWSPPAEDDTSSVTTNATSYTITALTPCTPYIVSVRAMNFTNQTLGISSNEAAITATPVTNVSSVAVDAVANQSSLLDVSWKTHDDLTNCSTNFSITWTRVDDATPDEIFTTDLDYTIAGLDAFTRYNVCVSTCLSDAFMYPVCGVNMTTEDGPPPSPRTPSWVVWVSVVVVVLLVVVGGVALYSFRDKLKMFKPRTRPLPSANHSILDLNTRSPPPDQVSAGAVQEEDLRNYIKCLEEDTQRGLEDEFEQVQQNSAKHPTEAATEDFNKGKNRFRNILPFDHSRVILPILVGEPSSDYINANHIKDTRERQPFVACQGPTDSTVRDFWRLVWQLNAGVVVMLTNLRERGRERCALYWPPKEVPVITVGEDLTVTRCGVSRDGGVRVREFLLQKDKHQRPIRQYHLTTWPDFGVPSHEHHLLDFIHEIRNFASPASGPLVVHCSAGVGRTGTFIGLWNMMEAVDEGLPASVNVQQTVLAMRECRCNMVQSPVLRAGRIGGEEWSKLS